MCFLFPTGVTRAGRFFLGLRREKTNPPGGGPGDGEAPGAGGDAQTEFPRRPGSSNSAEMAAAFFVEPSQAQNERAKVTCRFWCMFPLTRLQSMFGAGFLSHTQMA